METGDWRAPVCDLRPGWRETQPRHDGGGGQTEGPGRHQPGGGGAPGRPEIPPGYGDFRRETVGPAPPHVYMAMFSNLHSHWSRGS